MKISALFKILPARRRRLKFVVLFALLLLGLALFWRPLKSAPPVYLSEMVGQGDIEDAVLASGVLQPIARVEVGAQVSGQLKSLKVKLGERVLKGQLLAEIDPSLALNDQKVAMTELGGLLAQRDGVAADLTQAQEEAGRQDVLRAGAASSDKEWRRAQTQLALRRSALAELDARIARSRLQIDRQRTELAYRRITAPMTGEVLTIDTREGQTVIAAQQAPKILTLGDLSRMVVWAQVSEADIVRIRTGQRAYFSLLGSPLRRHYGVVREIQPAPEKINNAMFYRVLFDVENPDRALRTEMSAQVGIVQGEIKHGLILPLSALGEQGADGRYQVRVLAADGAALRRQVRIGLKGRTHAQVLDGLRAGERVVTSEPDDARLGVTLSVG
jgi:macrolide-specific efflux system membrane fusion protein